MSVDMMTRAGAPTVVVACNLILFIILFEYMHIKFQLPSNCHIIIYLKDYPRPGSHDTGPLTCLLVRLTS